jgi:hypothetical protein
MLWVDSFPEYSSRHYYWSLLFNRKNYTWHKLCSGCNVLSMNLLIQKLEAALLRRNALLNEKLQPGLPEAKIKSVLMRAKITGELQPIFDLYSWKNGTILDRDLASLRTGFFPDAVYHFTDLKFATAHMKSFRELGEYRDGLAQIAAEYFPAFWDGSTGWLAIDLKPFKKNRVVKIEFETEKPIHELYSSFEEFLKDAIRANEENGSLACFE